MNPAALRRLALAVFLLFGMMGPLSALMESQLRLVSWRFILFQTFASGAMAANIILLARWRWWTTAAVIVFWTTALVINSGALSFIVDEHGVRAQFSGLSLNAPTPAPSRDLTLSPQELDAIYTQRAILGALSIGLLASGYVMFIRVISKELQHRVRLETEVSIARTIQQSLLPSATLKAPHAEISGATVPAAEVGGDIFDIVELPENRIALAMADVTGHGVGAGIVSAMTKSALRSQLQHDASPANVLENLNRTIYQVSDERTFVTFAYALLDLTAGQMQFATAGHPPLLLCHGGSSEVQSLRTVNLALGMKEQTAFASDEISVGKGDSVLLYTDGILEAANTDGEQFQSARLAGSFSAPAASSQEKCSRLLAEAQQFSKGTQQADDMSVVCVILK